MSIDEDINITRIKGNDEHFIDNFVNFKKVIKSINEKIANLNMTDQFPQGNNLNEQQEKWKEANNS